MTATEQIATSQLQAAATIAWTDLVAASIGNGGPWASAKSTLLSRRRFAGSADAALASTINLGSVAAKFVRVTSGTGPIGSFGTSANIEVVIRFAVAATISAGALTNLSTAITLQVGDVIRVNSDGSGAFYLSGYLPAVSSVASQMLTFPSQALAAAANLTSHKIIYLSGWAAPGDGGHAHWVKVPAAPVNHTAYFTSADGSYWQIYEWQVDSLMVGAKCNTSNFDDATIAGGFLNVVNFSHPLPATLVAGDHIVIWPNGQPYASAGPLFTGAIQTVNSSTQITLASNASAAVTNGCGRYGSDDSVAIAKAQSICQSLYDFFHVSGDGPVSPPGYPVALGASAGWFYQGICEHVFRGRPGQQGMYGVSTPILYANNASVRCLDTGIVAALPQFTGSGVFMPVSFSGTPQRTIKATFKNLKIDGLGLDIVGLYENNASIYTRVDGATINGCQLGGLWFGAGTSGNNTSTASLGGEIRIEGAANNVDRVNGAFPNNTAGIGLYIGTNCADMDSSGVVRILGYYNAYQNAASDNNVCGAVHCWTDASHGFMQTGGNLSGGWGAGGGRVYIDTPCAAPGTTAYGIVIGKNGSCDLDDLLVGINAVVGITQDNSVIAVSDQRWGIGPSFQRFRPRIKRLTTESSSSSVKFAMGVDDSLRFGNYGMLLDDYVTDGNTYDIGILDERGRQFHQRRAAISGLYAQVANNMHGDVPATVATTGSTHSNNVIDSIPSTANLKNGMIVQASDIPAGTYIQSITSSTAIKISANATGTNASESITFTGRASPLWTPYNSSVASQVRWWFNFNRAESVKLDGAGKIMHMASLLSNGGDIFAHMSNPAWRPTLNVGGLGGLNTATFDGISSYLDVSSPDDVQTALSMVVVLIPRTQQSTGNGQKAICVMNGGPSCFAAASVIFNTNNRVYAVDVSNSTTSGFVGPATVGTACIVTATFSTSGGGVTRFNAADTMSSAVSLAAATSNEAIGGYASQGQSGYSRCAMDLAEIIMMVGPVADGGAGSTSVLRQVEGYAAWNNGVQSVLPSSHAYFAAPPTA